VSVTAGCSRQLASTLLKAVEHCGCSEIFDHLDGYTTNELVIKHIADGAGAAELAIDTQPVAYFALIKRSPSSNN
jgi:hypothetical protein